MTSAAVSGVEVWESLWRDAPDARHDSSQLLREERSPRWAAVMDALISTFGRIDGLRTVELGCGRGDLSALLAARGAEVTLVDYSAGALAQARERFARLKLKADFTTDDLLGDLDTLAGRFDVSCSLGVIEHFKGPRRARAVAAHRKVLCDRGLAIISVPYALGVPYRLWKMYLEVRRWWPYGMEIPYGKGELRRLAEACGFERTELNTTGFWQSIGDYWGRNVLGLSPDWVERRSCLDPVMGGTLTMFAWAGGQPVPRIK